MFKKLFLAIAAPAALLSLSACMTGFPTQVQRFNAMPAPDGQSFVIQPVEPEDRGSLEFAQYADHVRRNLIALGYREAASPRDASLLVTLDYGVDGGRERIVSTPGVGYGGFGRPYFSRFGYFGRGRHPFFFGWHDPLFDDFGRKTHDLGAFGNGMKMKFVANLLVAIHNVASAEAMVLGMKAGLDPHQLYELVMSGAGNSRVFELRAGMMADNRYDGDNVTMKVSIWQKDMKVIGDYAQRIGVPTPTFSACEPVYNAAMSTGHAGDDTASVCAVLEAMAGLRR